MGSSVGTAVRRVVAVGSIDRLIDDLLLVLAAVVGFGSHFGEERALR